MNELIEAAAPSAKNTGFDLSPQNFEQAMTFSQMLADSDMVPKDFKGKQGNCLVAIQWGMEIGLKPLQAMQNIAVINGRPSLWGDAVIALVRSSPVCEYVIETQTDDVATCKVKRRGEPEQERTFSKSDAQAAGLKGKPGPWTQYPKRMMQMRARAFACRDVFPDILKGLPVAEEVMDTPRDMGRVQVVPAAAIEESAPANLVLAAETAASLGMASYQDYWKSATADNRKLLKGEHERLKALAVESDKSRTIDNATLRAAPSKASQTTGEITYSAVMERLQKAGDVDALDIAADWIKSVDCEDLQTVLTGKYQLLRASFE
jgi:hypothetical protein